MENIIICFEQLSWVPSNASSHVIFNLTFSTCFSISGFCFMLVHVSTDNGLIADLSLWFTMGSSGADTPSKTSKASAPQVFNAGPVALSFWWKQERSQCLFAKSLCFPMIGTTATCYLRCCNTGCLPRLVQLPGEWIPPLLPWPKPPAHPPSMMYFYPLWWWHERRGRWICR